MPGSTFRPLEVRSSGSGPSQLEQFRSAAKEGTPFEELVGLTEVDTGLRNSAMAHLTEDWLKWRDGQLFIDVPAYQKCTLGSANDGRGGDTTQTGEPCYHCVDREMEERIEEFLPAAHKLPDGGDCWAVKSESGYKGRQIPVQEEDTQRIIETYFRIHDRVGSQTAVRAAVKRIAKRAGLFEEGGEDEQDWPTPHDLRDTYGTRLAVKGFTRDEIKTAMGHSSIQQADDYVQMSGIEASQAFDEKW